MIFILVVGSCCGAYRTWKSDDDTSFDGTESSRTAKIQVNKYTNVLTLGSFRTLFGFTRLTSEALFKKSVFSYRSDRNLGIAECLLKRARFE